MQRRAFLSLFPAGLAVPLAAWPPAPAAPTGERVEDVPPLADEEAAALLDAANEHRRQLHEIVRRWWRHPDAHREASALLECLAEAWCRRRGAAPSAGRTHWHAMAGRRPDAVTGVPWREADDAVQRLEEHANRLVPWQQKAVVRSEDVEYWRIPHSTRDVQRVLDVATRCHAAVRGECMERPRQQGG